jgi:hypothetical protein
MTPEQRGGFVHLLAHAWDADPPCTLPDSDFELAALSGLGERWGTAGVFIKLQFQSVDGRLRNPKQWAIFCDWRRFKRLKAQSGKRGAKSRWQSDGKPIANVKQASSERCPSSSPSLALSTSSSSRALVSSFESDETAERAGRLVERYGELYAQYRHGARHRQRPNLDWIDACGLVKLWPDDRLDKLAILVLTTDDVWISGTDRAFKIFALKATWADAKLAEWEQQHQEKPA